MEKSKEEIFKGFQELVKSVEDGKCVVICNWGIEDKCGKIEVAKSLSQAVDMLCEEHFLIKNEILKKIKF
jgi:hypothetical protein